MPEPRRVPSLYPGVSFTIVSKPPTMDQMQEMCIKWCRMKQELDEEITADSMKDELVPLLVREWKLEVVERS